MRDAVSFLSVKPSISVSIALFCDCLLRTYAIIVISVVYRVYMRHEGSARTLKRYLMIIAALAILLIGSSVPGFSAGSEHWLFTGLDVDFTFFKSSDSTWHDIVGNDSAYLNSMGFDVSWYGFFGSDTDVGVYMSLGFLFPMEDSLDQTSDSAGADGGMTRKRDFLFSTLIGPAFRLRCTEDLTMYIGVGMKFAHHTVKVTSSDKTSSEGLTSFGVGIDAGVKLDITARVCFRSGVSSSFDFARLHTSSDVSPADATFSSSFRITDGFSVTPYVGMGVVLKTRQERIEPRTVSLAVLASKDRR